MTQALCPVSGISRNPALFLYTVNDDRHYATDEERVRALDDFDVILIRQDPPFDMGYVSNTYLLELTKALVLNPPRGVVSHAAPLLGG